MKPEKLKYILDTKYRFCNFDSMPGDMISFWAYPKDFCHKLARTRGYHIVCNALNITSTYVIMMHNVDQALQGKDVKLARQLLPNAHVADRKFRKFIRKYFSLISSYPWMLDDDRIFMSYMMITNAVRQLEEPIVVPQEAARLFMIGKLAS